MITCEAAMNKN